jgi:hypothetical protein
MLMTSKAESALVSRHLMLPEATRGSLARRSLGLGRFSFYLDGLDEREQIRGVFFLGRRKRAVYVRPLANAYGVEFADELLLSLLKSCSNAG